MHVRAADGSRSRKDNESIFDEPDLLEVNFPTESWTDTDIVIAVMGPTGAGKSTFINKLAPDQTVVGQSLRSCTQEVQTVQCFDSQGRRIILVDTPGFNDTNLSDLEVLELITNWLKQTFQKGKLLSGLLFLHRISDNRMGRSPLRLLETFKNICGKDAFQNVILVTTMWDEVEPEDGAGREQELRRTYWNHMIALGSRTKRSYNTEDSAWHIISEFGPGTRRPLLVQEEMVNERKPLSETTAGRPLFDWLVGAVRTVQKAVKTLQANLRRAKKGDRPALEENIRRRQRFLEVASPRIVQYSTSRTIGTEEVIDVSRPPSAQGPTTPSYLAPAAPYLAPAAPRLAKYSTSRTIDTEEVIDLSRPPSAQGPTMSSYLAPVAPRLVKYSTSRTMGMEEVFDISRPPSVQGPTMPSYLAPVAPRLVPVVPHLAPVAPYLAPVAAPALVLTISEPASVATTTLSSPTDSHLSEYIDLRILRTKSVRALKTIHQLIGAFPIPGLSSLVEMVVKIGEMIEATDNHDLLSQFQDICDVTSSIIEAAQAEVNGRIEAIIRSFMKDMSEIRRIVNRTSSKNLSEEFLSDKSTNMIDKYSRMILEEGNRLGIKRLVFYSSTTAMEERLNLLIKVLRTRSTTFHRS